VTKCTFHNYGPSGTVEKKDGLCVLPLNIINEKIYIFIWFWLIIVAIITGLAVVGRLIILAMPKLRVTIINWRVTKNCICIENISRKQVDWFSTSSLMRN
jgi:hypothetical protein